MDLNRVILIWRVTNDLEVKKMESGASVVNFSIATNRKYKNKEENIVEESEFHRCVAFWNQADIIWKYLEKWKKVFIEGRLRTRKREDNQWQPRYTTEIIIENFIFLDNKSSSWHVDAKVDAWNIAGDEELPF